MNETQNITPESDILSREDRAIVLKGIEMVQSHIHSRMNGNGGIPSQLQNTDKACLSGISGGLVYLANLIEEGATTRRIRLAYQSLLKQSDTSENTHLQPSVGVFHHRIAGMRNFEILNNGHHDK